MLFELFSDTITVLSGCENARVAIVLSCHLWPQIKTAELMFNADTRAN